MRAYEFISEDPVPVVMDPVYARDVDYDDNVTERQLVTVNVDAFDSAWEHGREANTYITPGGGGNTIRDRYAQFGKWLENPRAPTKASTVHVSPTGSVEFYNGRHRFAWMRDHGLTPIQVAMDPASIKYAKQYGLIK